MYMHNTWYIYMHYTCPKDTSGVSMFPWPGTQHKQLATISCDDPGTIMSLLKKARIVFQTSLRSAYVYHKNKTPGDIPSVRLLHPLHSVNPVHLLRLLPRTVSPMAWHFTVSLSHWFWNPNVCKYFHFCCLSKSSFLLQNSSILCCCSLETPIPGSEIPMFGDLYLNLAGL